MKGTFFSKPLEWNIQTIGETWQQGEMLKGILWVKNHGNQNESLIETGVVLAHADIKKIHSRTEGALKTESKATFKEIELLPGEEAKIEFSFLIGPNGAVTDKKASYYLGFGKKYSESQLQVKVIPKELYTKIVSLLDTFHRFKLKEYKATKKGVEFKLLPPTSREMANIESVFLIFSMVNDDLMIQYNFQVKKLDTSSITTKINKESITLEQMLSPKEYSLGRDMINQDQLLRSLESVISEVKLKSVF